MQRIRDPDERREGSLNVVPSWECDPRPAHLSIDILSEIPIFICRVLRLRIISWYSLIIVSFSVLDFLYGLWRSDNVGKYHHYT